MRRVLCETCQNWIEFEDKTIWEGNRDFEKVICPVCGNLLAEVFTDLTPNPRVAKKALSK